MGVSPDEERGGKTCGAALVEHLDVAEVLRVVAKLHSPGDERRVDRVGIALQGHRGGPRHLADHGPAERLSETSGIDAAVRPGGLEARDRALVGLCVDAAVGDGLRPGREEVVQLLEARNAVVERLGEERFADVAVQSFLLSPPLRRVGTTVDEAHPEDCRCVPARRS